MNINDLSFTPLVPLLLVGPPGIGKTAIVESKFGHTETLLSSSMVEEDIAGLPFRENHLERRTLPSWLERLQIADSNGLSTCLFLDELDKARRSVSDTLLTLVASRKVGIHTLPLNTCLVAACNPPEAGGADGISEPMMSRFSILEVEPDVCAWADWAEGVFGPSLKRFIKEIKTGIIPLVDRAGEGFLQRTTCPRTIDLSIKALVSLGPEKAAPIIKGLLTANVASALLYRTEENHIQSQREEAIRVFASTNKKIRRPYESKG